jgi:hypothetical protein
VRIANFAENIVANFLASAIKDKRGLAETEESIKYTLIDMETERAKDEDFSHMIHKLYRRV